MGDKRFCCNAGPPYTYDSTIAQQVAQFYEAQQAAYLQPGSQVCQLGLTG